MRSLPQVVQLSSHGRMGFFFLWRSCFFILIHRYFSFVCCHFVSILLGGTGPLSIISFDLKNALFVLMCTTICERNTSLRLLSCTFKVHPPLFFRFVLTIYVLILEIPFFFPPYYPNLLFLSGSIHLFVYDGISSF